MKQAEVEVKVEQRSDFPHLSFNLSLNLPLTLADFFSILQGDSSLPHRVASVIRSSML